MQKRKRNLIIEHCQMTSRPLLTCACKSLSVVLVEAESRTAEGFAKARGNVGVW